MTVNFNVTDTPATGIVNNRFSWHRVGMLYEYYSPVLKKQCIIYFAFSVICAILTLLPLNEVLQVEFFTVIWTALPLMYLMSPCAFGKNDASPIVERLLPVKTSERLVFFFSYFFIALPITLYTLPGAAMWIYQQIPALQTEGMMRLFEIKAYNPFSIRFLNLLTTISGLLTCLCVVETARTNKIFKGIISVIAINFIEGLLGAVYGFKEAFQKGFEDGKSGMPSEDPNALTLRIIDEMANCSGYLIFMYALFAVYIGVLVWILYRTLKHRNM